MRRPWLAPLMPLYAAGLALRNRRFENGSEQVKRLCWPVVSIGNLSTGGSGKTPLTIALAQVLAARGLWVDVLSRGYGRKSQSAARVDPDGSAEEFGDEPLLIARETGLPVYVAAQRYEAGLLAEADAQAGGGQRVHLLDDGFQHRQLARDVNILLIDHRDWQDSLLPAGNLREPLKAMRRSDVIAIPKEEAELELKLKDWGWQGPVWRLRRRMEIPSVSGSVAAFCGIARPEQFFDGLVAGGLQVALRRAFPDHFTYTRAVLQELTSKARAAGATALVTTEKDLVRLGPLSSLFPKSMPLVAAHLRVEIEDEEAALDWLVNRLKQTSTNP